MQDSQFRWYFRLLCFCWTNKKKPCYLPNDDEKLRIYAGCKSKKLWARNKDFVLANFTLSDDKLWLSNERLLTELATIMELTEKRTDAGRRGAESRWQTHGKRIASGKQKMPPTPTPTPTQEESTPLASPPVAVQQETFIDLPLNDNTEYGVPKLMIEELEKLYPAVDVPQEFRSMKAWLLANRDKRKTRKGILRFANSWLAKQQDRMGSTHGKVTDRAGKNDHILGRHFEEPDR